MGRPWDVVFWSTGLGLEAGNASICFWSTRYDADLLHERIVAPGDDNCGSA